MFFPNGDYKVYTLEFLQIFERGNVFGRCLDICEFI